MPDDVTKIANLPALRALADPVRIRILDLLGAEARTVKELAAVLGVPRNRLHYHVNVLQKHGLVGVASTRVVNGATERRYETTSRTFEVDRLALPAAAAAGVAAGVAGLIQATARDVDESLRSRQRTAVGTGRVRITADQHAELVARIEALISEYEAAPAPEGAPATILFAVYGDKA